MLNTPARLEESYAAAERVTRQWARSFHFASTFLPPAKRRAVFAIYDFCRHADNLVDLRGPRSAADVRRDLAGLAELVCRVHRGERPDDPRWLALWDSCRRYAIPLPPLLAMLEGVERDLGPVTMPDFAALHHYCTQVAGGVGLMLGPVLGARGEEFREFGIGLGVAMQLTNILRDLAEDLDAGRVYLPADEMAAHGVTRAMLEARRMTPALRRLLAFQVLRARYYYGLGDAVIDLFPSDGSRLTVRLMQRTYAAILDALERRDLDVFQGRAYVSQTRKLLILGRSVLTDRMPAMTHGAHRTA